MFDVFKKLMLLLMPLLICILCWSFIKVGGDLSNYRFDFATYFKNFSSLNFPLDDFLDNLKYGLNKALSFASFDNLGFDTLWKFQDINDLSSFFQNIGIFFNSLINAVGKITACFGAWFLYFFYAIYQILILSYKFLEFLVKLIGVLVDVPLIALN